MFLNCTTKKKSKILSKITGSKINQLILAVGSCLLGDRVLFDGQGQEHTMLLKSIIIFKENLNVK